MNSKKPIIAAVNGDAIAGGCQLAFQCDYRLTFNSTKFQMPETAIGLPIQENVTMSMDRVIGNPGKTAWFLQTGVAVQGQKAKELNIVDQLVDVDEQQMMEAAVRVLKEEYFYTKSVPLNKKINCASTARRNGRLPLIKDIEDLLSGKRKVGSGGAYVGLKGMTNKSKSKL